VGNTRRRHGAGSGPSATCSPSEYEVHS
jgi:hypothetical protein